MGGGAHWWMLGAIGDIEGVILFLKVALSFDTKCVLSLSLYRNWSMTVNSSASYVKFIAFNTILAWEVESGKVSSTPITCLKCKFTAESEEIGEKDSGFIWNEQSDRP